MASRRSLLIVVVATSLLAACSSGRQTAFYRKNPQDLMKEVVRCENNYRALANTDSCRAALRLNSELFR
ncbi:MAG TPA: EexN family lipoprotein [Acetobacteraceae bacterium]|nr:EexN family lipoprotein [Acetobacteraceae bacterium]